MEAYAQVKWKVDLKAMVCKNTSNNIVVGFERNKGTILGYINDMPFELLAEWSRKPNGEKLLQEAVIEAEHTFFKAYFANSKIKREGRN